MTQQIQEHILTISKIIDETPLVKVFQLEPPQNVNIDFYPGQFFMVSFVDDAIKTPRAYSIASSPLNKAYLEIAFNKVGSFTTKLFTLNVGDMLRFKGPYGKFYFHDEIKNNLVLIAGGTGLTPLMSIVRYCNDKKLGNKIRFLYSVKTPNDVIYKKDLEKIEKENNNFKCIVTATRPNPSDNWKGRTGRINIDLLKQSIEDVGGSIYYLCGPKEFMHSIIGMLEALSVKREHIKADIWG